MKARTFLLIVGCILIMILGIWWLDQDRPSAEQGVSAGDPLIPFDLNEVGQIHIVRDPHDVVVAYRDGRWVIPAAYDYPADFARLASELRALLRIQIGQVIRGGEDLLPEFGLDPDAEEREERPYMTVTFSDRDHEPLGHLAVGRVRQIERDERPSMFTAESAYMRLDDGPVVLIANSLRMFPTSQGEWIRSRLVELESQEIRHLRMRSRNGEELAIERSDTVGFTSDELIGTEQLNVARSRQWFNSFRFIDLVGVAAPRYEDVPDAFLDAYDLVEIDTTDGRRIVLRLGEPAPDGHPYIQVTVLHADSGEPHPEQEEFEGWTLTLLSHLKTQILPDRANLVTRPDAIPPPATDAFAAPHEPAEEAAEPDPEEEPANAVGEPDNTGRRFRRNSDRT